MPPSFRRCGFHFCGSHAPILCNGLSGRKAVSPKAQNFDLFVEESEAPKLESGSVHLANWHCTLPSAVSLESRDFAQQTVQEVILCCHPAKGKSTDTHRRPSCSPWGERVWLNRTEINGKSLTGGKEWSAAFLRHSLLSPWRCLLYP